MSYEMCTYMPSSCASHLSNFHVTWLHDRLMWLYSRASFRLVGSIDCCMVWTESILLRMVATSCSRDLWKSLGNLWSRLRKPTKRTPQPPWTRPQSNTLVATSPLNPRNENDGGGIMVEISSNSPEAGCPFSHFLSTILYNTYLHMATSKVGYICKHIRSLIWA